MKHLAWILSALSLPLGQAAAYLVTPDGTPAPGSTEDCSYWIAYIEYATCELIEEVYQITAAEFEEWNPIVTELGSDCEMLPGLYYCVQIDFIYPTTTVAASSATATATSAMSTSSSGSESLTSTSTTLSTTLSTAPSTVTSTATGTITTPAPIQTGMVSDCDAFYLVVSGDTCATIASDYGISLADFYAWNPAVGDTCADLWAEDYVCVGITEGSSSAVTGAASATSTTAVSTTNTTSSSTGVATPTPYETGMVDDCDAFHLVVSGDTCATIVSDAGITLDDFYEWNPTVGDTCSGLWVDYYVCIGIE